MTARLDDGLTPVKTATTTSTSGSSGSSSPLVTQVDAGSVDPRVIYAYLVTQHGVSPAAAAGILANIRAESSFRPGAAGDGGTSGGLFQHHADRFRNLQNFATSRGTSWYDWRTQVDFAMVEAKQMGINLQATDPVAASREWTVRFERPSDANTKATQRANSVQQYMYGDATQFQGMLNQAMSTTGTAAGADAGPVQVPDGGSWFKVDGEYYIAYRFWGNDEKTGPSHVVYYKASGMSPPPGTQVHAQSTWEKYSASWQNGGTVDAFRGTSFATYQEFVNDFLMKMGLAGSDALSDADVMAIIGIALTREMSEAELANRIRQTAWWQSKTDKEREWNDLSDAEKEQRTVEEAMKMVQLWFTYVGEDLDMASYDRDGDGRVSGAELQAGNADLFKWAQNIASGQASQVEAVNVWMKDSALQNPESPWSRSVRQEEQAQGQHTVDIKNTAGQIRDMYADWGMPINEANLLKMAEDVVMNRMAIEDVEGQLRDQASGLYPHKPPTLSTRQWATPYMQMYMNLLETPEPGLDDPLLQQGLTQGMSLADFQKALRADDRWLSTTNARDEMNTKISQLGRVMGF